MLPNDNSSNNSHGRVEGSSESNNNGVAQTKSGFVQRFNRGDKASVSVRLRNKKTAEQLAEKKKSRHSGDFSFFTPSLSNLVTAGHKMDSGPEEEDWSYITFPNGVAQVTELKTNGNNEPTRTPVKVVTRKVPGLQLHEKIFNSPSDTLGSTVSTSVSAVSNGHVTRSTNNKRQSCDFGALNSKQDSANNNSHSSHALHNRQRLFAQNRRQSMDVNAALLSASNIARASPSASPMNGRNNFRRRSEQHHRPAAGAVVPPTTATISKRCSGEFQFVKNGAAPSSGESANVSRVQPAGVSSRNSGAVARNTGLGRRAATQLNMQHNKKNSYNKAMYKSHDNLVKPGLSPSPCSTDSTPTSTSAFSSPSTSPEHHAGNSNPQRHLLIEEVVSATVKKGLLWQQRDKIFSRWKERFFILTKEYLNCFKRGNLGDLSEMGEFLYKVNLREIEDVELLDKRGYLTICVTLCREGKIYLRKTEGIKDWYKQLRECQRAAAAAKSNPGSTEKQNFWAKKQITDSTSIDNWLQKRKGMFSNYSDSSPDIHKSSSEKSQITLDQLSDLYRNEDEEAEVEEQLRSRTRSQAVTSGLEVASRASENGVRLRQPRDGSSNAINDDLSRNNQRKVIHRLSLMPDLELQELAASNHFELNHDKGFFRRNKIPVDFHSNDSGNHSISTNASVASTTSSKSKSSNEDREDSYPVNARRRKSGIHESNRRSPCVQGLQITHV